MRVGTLLKQFYRVKQASGKKPATLRWYRGQLKPFADRFALRDAAGLRRVEILEYLQQTSRGLSDSSRRHRIVALKQFQQFCRREAVIKRRWIRPGDIEVPPMGRRERFPTTEEIGQILPLGTPPWRRCYLAIIQSGARPGEIVRAQIEDIRTDDAGNRWIELADHKTAGKTGRPRIIPIGPQLAETVREAIGRRIRGPIFLDDKRKAWSVQRLSKRFSDYRDRLGLDRRIVLYCGRHYFATTLLTAKVEPLAVSKLLGHASLNTLRIYDHTTAVHFTAGQAAIPRIEIKPS